MEFDVCQTQFFFHGCQQIAEVQIARIVAVKIVKNHVYDRYPQLSFSYFSRKGVSPFQSQLFKGGGILSDDFWIWLCVAISSTKFLASALYCL